MPTELVYFSSEGGKEMVFCKPHWKGMFLFGRNTNFSYIENPVLGCRGI